MRIFHLLILALIPSLFMPLLAQNQEIQKPITLANCLEAAHQNYPATRQKLLIQQNRQDQLTSLTRNYLPQVNLNAQATYQSAVTSVPISSNLFKIIPPDKDQYKVTADFSQILFDGGITEAQKSMASAQALVDESKLEQELYRLKEKVTQLYLGILLLDKQLEQLTLLEKDLQENFRKVTALKANGLSNENNLDLIRAEQLRLEQKRLELKSARTATLQGLSLLSGLNLDEKSKLQVPEKPVLKDEILRPELQTLRNQQELLGSQLSLTQRKLVPKAMLFGQAGYGKPGLNMLKNEFEWFYLAGARITWNPSTLYTLGKEKQIIKRNSDALKLQEESFVLQTRVGLQQAKSEIEKAENLILVDEELLKLRKRIRQNASIRLAEGILSASDYIHELLQEEQVLMNKSLHEIQLLSGYFNYQLNSGN
ncbi:TolC family protein [Bacteroidota bacterium]